MTAPTQPGAAGAGGGVLALGAETPPHPLQELAFASIMIRRWLPEAFPPNAQGQVHFVRAVMESVADSIDRSAPVTADLLAALQNVMQWISGWDPSFIHDDEWPASQAAARAAIAKALPQVQP